MPGGHTLRTWHFSMLNVLWCLVWLHVKSSATNPRVSVMGLFGYRTAQADKPSTAALALVSSHPGCKQHRNPMAHPRINPFAPSLQNTRYMLQSPTQAHNDQKWEALPFLNQQTLEAGARAASLPTCQPGEFGEHKQPLRLQS